MHRWGLASLLSVLFLPLAASAQAQDADVAAGVASAPPAAAPQAITYGAMPGGLHAPTAEVLPPGSVQVSTLTGFGRRTGLLGPDHKFDRAIGDLAVAYGATDYLSIGLSLDGRYDRHFGLAGDPSIANASTMQISTKQADGSPEDGYVGDPHLIVRAAKNTGSLAFGGQLGVWVPGKDAPSVAGSAISVDVRALVSLPAGPGVLSFSGGFRLDNSVKSVDQPMSLSMPDRVSLGVSDYNALFGAAQLRFPAGKMWVAVEGSLDAFLGDPPAPSGTEEQRLAPAEGRLTVRGAVTGGYSINEAWSAVAFIEAAKVPGILDAQIDANNIPLVPYEPLFTLGVGLEARFGGAKPSYAFLPCSQHNPPDCPDVKAPILAEISGSVVDNTGKPVVGAKVSLTLKNAQVSPVPTDEKGNYIFKGVPIGHKLGDKPTIDESVVEVGVDVGGMKPGKATLSNVKDGVNPVPPITLEPTLPPGQLRGLVRSLPGGKPVAGATITVTPGNAKAETAADGTFTIDLAPGEYKVKCSKPGFKDQELDAAIAVDPSGVGRVVLKNFELTK